MLSAVVADGAIYAAYAPGTAAESTVVALDPATGSRRWSRTVPGAAALAFADGRLVIRDGDDVITALDGVTGARIWTNGLVPGAGNRAAPVISDGLISVGSLSDGGTHLQLRLSDGSQVWSQVGSPAGASAEAGDVSIQSDGCQTQVYDARSGAPGWRTDLGCRFYSGMAASDGGRVVTFGGRFGLQGRVLDLADGFVRDSLATTTLPAMAGDTLITVSGSTVRATSLTTGLELWSASGVGEAGSPLIVDGLVYVPWHDGTVVAYDLAAGTPVWAPPEALDPDPDFGTYDTPTIAAGPGALLVTNAGRLVAYGTPVSSPAAGLAILSGPHGPTRAGSATFTWTAGADQQCRLDAEAWTGCTSPRAYPDLADGPHTFSVRTLDGAGQVIGLAARGFVVDRTAPVTNFEYTPAVLSRTANASFTWNNPGAVTATCQLDDETPVACVHYINEDAPDGTHTFRVVSTDMLGNVEATPASYTWTVDTTAPAIVFDEHPPPFTSATTARFRMTISGDPTSLTCSWDDGPMQACSSTTERSGFADGAHEFNVRATDAAGNVALATITWNVDTVPPQTTITGGPQGGVSSSDIVYISFDAGYDVDYYECGLDAGPYTRCQSPYVVHVLPGRHTVRVRAVDRAGNVERSPVEATFDVAPPSTTTPVATGTPVATATPTTLPPTPTPPSPTPAASVPTSVQTVMPAPVDTPTAVRPTPTVTGSPAATATATGSPIPSGPDAAIFASLFPAPPAGHTRIDGLPATPEQLRASLTRWLAAHPGPVRLALPYFPLADGLLDVRVFAGRRLVARARRAVLGGRLNWAPLTLSRRDRAHMRSARRVRVLVTVV